MRPNTVSIEILDKSYQVACEPEQEDELLLAARDLDAQMRAIRSTGKVIGIERVAIMAALNLSHQLLLARGAPSAVASPDNEDQIKSLMKELSVQVVTADKCEYGLVTPSAEERNKMVPALKPTRFMTKSPIMAQQLSKNCQGRHQHQHLSGTDAVMRPITLCPW